MRAVLFLALLIAALSGRSPAAAQSALARRATQANPCAGEVFRADFAGRPGGALYCLGGKRYSSLGEMPFASFSRASTKSCSDSSGIDVLAASGAPCITDRGLLIEGASSNLLANSAVLTTQTVTVSATAYTLSFRGTGSVAMSGACSGSLSGQGNSTRASLAFTPTAGSCTLSVAGSVTNANLEPGSIATSWIPAASRAADAAFFNGVASLLRPPLTLVVTADLPIVDGVTRYLATVSDGSGNNKAHLRRNSTGAAEVQEVIGGSFQTPVQVANKTGARTLRMAVRVRAAAFSGSIDGAVAPGGTTGAPPSLSRIDLGQNVDGTLPLYGYIRSIALEPDLVDGQLQTITQ